MNRLIVLAVSILSCGLAAAQTASNSGEIRLIIQGDDMGAAHGINAGTIQAYKAGILRTTNLIVPGAWLPEAVRLLKENPELDVGVHLTITSEWEAVKWRPLISAPSLVDENGYFFRTAQALMSSHNTAGSKPKLDELEKELRAQIEMAKRLAPQVSYASTHMGFTSVSPEWGPLVRRLCQEYGLAQPGADYGLQSLGSVWGGGGGRSAPFETGDERGEKLAKRLEGLTPGTWRMVEHCGTDEPEMQSFSPSQNVGRDRAAVVAAWTHPRVLEVVKKRGIRLMGYRELLKETRR